MFKGKGIRFHLLKGVLNNFWARFKTTAPTVIFRGIRQLVIESIDKIVYAVEKMQWAKYSLPLYSDTPHTEQLFPSICCFCMFLFAFSHIVL